MTPITITGPGWSQTFFTAREAALALFKDLDRADLNPLFWADAARAELRRMPVVDVPEWTEEFETRLRHS